MNNFGQIIKEAKATYCGRCGTTHVKPSQGGKCPALKEATNTKGKPMKTLGQFMEETALTEAHDVELKPHSNGTHYIVHKIHPKSGIESDQLKKGEKISDSHVDDLHDMGYSVKIHDK